MPQSSRALALGLAFSLAAAAQAPAYAQPAQAAMPEATAATFGKKVLRSDLPVLVEFGATWCGYCRLEQPLLAALPQRAAGVIRVYSVDADRDPALVKKYGVKNFPTMVIMYGGKVIDRREGYHTRGELNAWVSSRVHLRAQPAAPAR